MGWSAADVKIFNDVEQHGWSVIIVAGDPWFAYTIGLYARFQKPEMIVFGLRKEDLHAACDAYGNDVRGGKEPTPRTYLDTQAVLRLIDARHTEEYLGTARWFYRQKEFPTNQLIWSDSSGLFPWDEGCSPEIQRVQPLLTIPTSPQTP